MITLCFTYDIVTPESAEHGDTSEHGFYADGWTYPMYNDDGSDGTGRTYERPIWRKPGDLRDAIKAARDLGCCAESGTLWFPSSDESVNYRTGESTSYAFHVDGVTPSTYNRIARLLGAKS